MAAKAADSYKAFPDEEELDEEDLNLRAVLSRASAALLFVGAVVLFIVGVTDLKSDSVIYILIALVLLVLFFVNVYFIQQEKVRLRRLHKGNTHSGNVDEYV